MRFSVGSLALLAGLVCAAPAAEREVQKRAELSTFVGTNAYWLPFLTSDTDVETTFQALSDAGLKVVRTWAFNDATDCSYGVYFQCWDSGSPVLNTGADGLERLDAVVAAAEKFGVQLIMPLVNNWGDYGGMDVYVANLGGSDTEHTSFYTNTAVQDAYKSYVETVVTRYANSSAILAWELANEPRCQGCDTSVITTWATDISAYIKSLDSTKLVALGDEGFFNDPTSSYYPYQGTEGVDFEANLAIDTLDFGTFHLYTVSWSQTYEWGTMWINDHAAACEAAGKLCVFEEYGVPEDGDLRTEWINTWHDAIANSSSIVGDAYWQFGLTLSGGLTSDDTYTIYTTDDNFQELVVDWAAERSA